MTGYLCIDRARLRQDIEGGSKEVQLLYMHMIIDAAFRDHTIWCRGTEIKLARGQVFMSSAKAIDLSEQELRTAIDRLRKVGAIRTQRVTSRGRIITLCNYEEICGSQRAEQRADQRAANEQLTSTKREVRETKGESKERKKDSRPDGRYDDQVPTDRKGRPYAWAGKIVRIDVECHATWSRSFSAIDLDANLQSIDDWLGSSKATDSQRKGWFHLVSNSLRKRHETALGGAQINGHVDGGRRQLV